MNRFFRRAMPYIVLIFGLFLLFEAYCNMQDRKAYSETTAEITDIQISYGMSTAEDEHRVFVKYSVDGVEYENLLGEYSSNMRIGQVIDILYDPADPYSIISAGYAMPIIFSLLGAASVVYFLLDTRKRMLGRENAEASA